MQTAVGNKPRQFTAMKHQSLISRRAGGMTNAPIHEFDTDAECPAQTVERETAVRLKELAIREDAHFTDVVARVWGEETGGE